MTGSVLEEIPGLGPTRRKRLIDHFGTLRELRAASREDLTALTWLPELVGKAVFARLHQDETAAVHLAENENVNDADGGD